MARLVRDQQGDGRRALDAAAERAAAPARARLDGIANSRWEPNENYAREVRELFTSPARMLVTADEWLLVASRQSVKAGSLQIQLYNRGADAHDIAARRVDRLGGRVGRTYRIRETRPGELAESTWRLRSGRYRLWCTLRGHEAAGMRARLRVR